jgi:hypothetical protein
MGDNYDRWFDVRVASFEACIAKHGLKYSARNRGYVDPGWVPIVDKLITELLALGWDGDLHQVKEKFGGLRFYVGAATPEMIKLIHAAEVETFTICEGCGKPGVQRTGGWIKTLCDRCDASRKAVYYISTLDKTPDKI